MQEWQNQPGICPKCGFAWSSHAPHPHHPEDVEWRMCPWRALPSYDVTQRGTHTTQADGSLIVVPADQEATVIGALVGPLYSLEPVCPLCGYQGAERVFGTTDGEVVVPCYLHWSAAHGVTAPIREGEHIPHPSEEQGRMRMIRCSSCRYWSHPSAFCRPTGPVHRRGE